MRACMLVYVCMCLHACVHAHTRVCVCVCAHIHYIKFWVCVSPDVAVGKLDIILLLYGTII